MSHDAASGEISPERDHVVMDWTRTQSTGLKGQLDCGARAFDYRPYLLRDTLYAHHGPVVIHKTMESSITEVQEWCDEHPNELILFYVNSCDGGDGCMEKAEKLLIERDIFTITDCTDLKTLTYEEAKERGMQNNGAGSIMAIIGCADENYDPSITCYGPQFVCYEEDSEQIPWSLMTDYMNITTFSDPTEKSSNIWLAQAHWQSDSYSVVVGTLHRSSLLLDNSRSSMNEWIEQSVYEGKFKYLNMLEVNNVCENGLNISKAIDEVYLKSN